MIQAIHTSVKGRARYKVHPLYGSESLKRLLEQSLSQRPEINYVSANPLTSNILVLFDQNKISYKKVGLIIEEVIAESGNKSVISPRDKLAKYQKSSPESTGIFYSGYVDSDSVLQSQKTQNRQTKEQKSRKSSSYLEKEIGGNVSISDTADISKDNWYLATVDQVLDSFKTSKNSGLSRELATENLQKYGLNILSETATRSQLSILIEQFKSLPVALLGVAAGISLFTGGVVDAIVIMGVVGLNAVIGYTTESQSERIIQSLRNRQQTSTWVIRDQTPIEIPTEYVALGDILILKPGIYVAADGRLIEADNLSIDESALTGESLPVTKTTESLTGENIPLGDRHNMIYKGTFVTSGQGLAVVVATGKFTEMGKIQQLVSEATAVATPLTRQLDKVGSQLVLLSMGICGFVFGLGVVRGYGLVQMLTSSISLAVAAVPEGLPTIATTTLALGIQDMRKNNVLVRSLNAVEALGSVQTICLDKTGTITENRMSVVEIQANTTEINVSDGELFAKGENLNAYSCNELLKLIHVSVLCNESQISQEENGEYVVTGSATENALIYMAISAGVNVINLRQKYPLVQTNLRSENRNIMSTIHQTDDHQKFVAVKGNPAEVVQICRWWVKQGQIVPLTETDRQTIEIANDRMAGKALRVLGIAYSYTEETDNNNNYESNLIWLGLVGMADPIRKGAKELIADFHEAGIDTVMITGDQSPTAYAIAKQLELNTDPQLEILDSSHLNDLTPEAMAALSDKVDVFARISPSNKLQIVQALQAAGKVVAMTGDGINDAPALKAAQVGIAMGKDGTDVAREVADIVLSDDRLETMMIAVSRGRTIYNNIRKSVHFLLATNLSEIMVMTIATAAGIGEPLNAIQLLWLNLVTDIFPGLSLAMEAPEPDVLSQSPRSPEEPIIKNTDFGRIAFESANISVSTLAAYGYAIAKYGIGSRASTIAFMSLTSAQLLHTISSRSEKHSIFSPEKLPNNPYLNTAIIGSFAIQVLAISLPQLRSLLRITPINLVDALVIAASGILPLLVNESTKNIPVIRNS